MRILVMGAGALGSVAGGLMSRAGHEVSLVGRAAHINAVRSQGLLIEGIWGSHHVAGMEAVTAVEDLCRADFDLVLIAVKSYDTRKAAQLVVPMVSPETWVCSYQNGLGNAEVIAREVGPERVLGARVIYGARIAEPGRVDVTVIAAPTAIGGYGAPGAAKAAKEVAAAMEAAGLPTVDTDRIQTVLWSKVAYNCALNPLSALLNVPYGALAENSHTRQIMDDVIEELYAVAEAMEVPLEPETADGYRESFYGKLLPPTAAHYASMREDLLLGRRTEVDALNGAIARFGAERHVPCPANGMLTALVHAREGLHNRGKSSNA